MSAERLRRSQEIYFAVADLPKNERAAALAAACGGDEELRAEIQSLLEHTDEVGNFLGTPILGTGFTVVQDTGPDEFVGHTIGHYRIDRRIASGGMGTVYLASRADAEFTQQVALKVVKRGMDSEEVLRRFKRERQTLAALNHPNIARLLDGGATPDGRPYLVMEFVEGIPLDRYCELHPLDTIARLRLFCQVCNAVSYAHHNLIVHRDLKPSNILVTPDGVPKLLDFGISTVLAGTGTTDVTSPSEQRLTPEYASPEQILGQPVSTATDVYSLGVILFELLAGARPYSFESRTSLEVQRIVCTQEPPPPSVAVARARARGTTTGAPLTIPPPAESSPERLRRKLAGDLDNIVLMALRKEPERRYASVEQLVADVNRFLENRPVAARKDTLSYRATKFVRRNKLACAFAATVLLSLVAGIAGVSWQARIADRERDAAYLARDQSEALARFLQKMLAEADPGRAGPDATLRDWVDATAAGLDAQLGDQPLIRTAVQGALGRLYISIGQYDKAEAVLNAALAERTRLLPPGHHDIAESEDDLANLYYAQGKLNEAEALLRSALAKHTQLRGSDNADTAQVCNDLGAVLRSAGKLDEAEAMHQRTLASRTVLFGAESLEAAESLNNLAGVARSRGQKQDAAAKSEPDESKKAALTAAGKAYFLEAEKLIANSYHIRAKVLKDNHPLVAQSLQNLAVMKAERGEFDEALTLLQNSLRSYEAIFSETHPAIVRALGSVSFVLKRKGMLAEAEPPLRRALALAERRFPATDPLVLNVHMQLARLLDAQGHIAEAEESFLRILALSEAEPRLADVTRAARTALFDFYTKLGRTQDAEKFAPKK